MKHPIPDALRRNYGETFLVLKSRKMTNASAAKKVGYPVSTLRLWIKKFALPRRK